MQFYPLVLPCRNLSAHGKEKSNNAGGYSITPNFSEKDWTLKIMQKVSWCLTWQVGTVLIKTTRICREIFLSGEMKVHGRGIRISAPLCHWRRKETLVRQRGERRGQEGRLKVGERDFESRQRRGRLERWKSFRMWKEIVDRISLIYEDYFLWEIHVSLKSSSWIFVQILFNPERKFN